MATAKLQLRGSRRQASQLAMERAVPPAARGGAWWRRVGRRLRGGAGVPRPTPSPRLSPRLIRTVREWLGPMKPSSGPTAASGVGLPASVAAMRAPTRDVARIPALPRVQVFGCDRWSAVPAPEGRQPPRSPVRPAGLGPGFLPGARSSPSCAVPSLSARLAGRRVRAARRAARAPGCRSVSLPRDSRRPWGSGGRGPRTQLEAPTQPWASPSGEGGAPSCAPPPASVPRVAPHAFSLSWTACLGVGVLARRGLCRRAPVPPCPVARSSAHPRVLAGLTPAPSARESLCWRGASGVLRAQDPGGDRPMGACPQGLRSASAPSPPRTPGPRAPLRAPHPSSRLTCQEPELQGPHPRAGNANRPCAGSTGRPPRQQTLAGPHAGPPPPAAPGEQAAPRPSG